MLLSADGSSVFFQGTPYDKNPSQVGPKSFIDKVAIKTGEKERIYESGNNNEFERVSTVIDADAKKFIVQRETPTDVPQNVLIDGGRRVTLTKNLDPHEDLTRAKVERFVVERADGFKFRVKVTLPADYKDGHAAAGAVLVLPARVRDAGGLRPPGPHVQQEQLHELRHALDGVLHPPRLRGRRTPTRRSSARRGR